MVTRIKRALQGAIVGLALGSSVASAALFNLFGPSTGVLVGNANSPQTSAATAVNITGLFTGCTGSPTTVFLRADGTCAVPAGAVALANPTGLIGLTAVNGTATTGTRSDGHAAIDQSIAPTWTGLWNWSYSASSSTPWIFTDSRLSPSGPSMIITQCCGVSASLQLTTTATGGNETMSFLANGGTTGTNDSVIFHNDTSGDLTILNRNTSGSVNLGTGTTINWLQLVGSNGDLISRSPASQFSGIIEGNGDATQTNAFVSGVPDLTSPGRAAFENSESITLKSNYGFLDNSNINFNDTGTIGHASYNSNPTFTGSHSWDHHHDYQAVMHLQSSGTATEVSSFWAQPQITSGTVTAMYLFNGQQPVQSGGTITTMYGMYIAPLTQGTTNWGLFVDGAEPNEFGGGLIVAGTKPSITSSAASLISIGANAGGTAQQWFIDSANSTNQKAWDLIVDTSACMSFRTLTDDLVTANPALQMCRSAATPSTISYNGVDVTPQTGTFTGTITGVTGTVTCTNTYYIISKIATVTLCSSGTGTGTSNATTLTMTGLPTVLRPAAIANQDLPIAGAEDAGVLVVTANNAFARVSTASGTIQFFKNGAAWTATGTKGITNPSPITYLLN